MRVFVGIFSGSDNDIGFMMIVRIAAITKIYVFSASLWLAAIIWGSAISYAHEIKPALLEFQLSSSAPAQLDLTLDMTAEIFLSGVNAGNLTDTDDSQQSDEYDRYRAQDAASLDRAVRARWPQLAEQIIIENGGARLALTLRDVAVQTGLLQEQVRQTRIEFSAAPLDSDKDIILGWAGELGPLIVRQIPGAKVSGDSAAPQSISESISGSALYAAYLAPGERSDAVQLAGVTEISLFDVVRRYLHSGFVHIIPLGLDHILFVLGLFLFSLSGRVLFYQISLFTLAHTFTLALSSLGIVRISGQIVEPLIALSIAYVAIETIWAKSRFSLQRAMLIIGFGLLHGLGFASVLADFGLPDAQFIPALVSFNIGVEAGQIAIVAPLYLLVRWLRPPARFYRVFVQIPASVIIASIGLYWTLDRVGWLPF